MNLEQTLTQIAADFGLNAEKLIEYAHEDTGIGGYHPDPAQSAYPSGSIFEVEGRILYALIEADNTTGIASIHGPNPAAVDCAVEHMKAPLGGELLVHQWSVDALLAFDGQLDLIFEDANHTAAEVEQIWRKAVRLLRPGGFMISHDVLHPAIGKQVYAGIVASGIGNFKTYRTDPSDCGLAIWRKPPNTVDKPLFSVVAKPVPAEPEPETEDEPSAEEKPKPKRRKRRKPAPKSTEQDERILIPA